MTRAEKPAPSISRRAPNVDEIRARRFLDRYPGVTSVVFEPDGNRAPDFLLDGRIAVEVRRLDKVFASPKGTRSVDGDSTRIMQGMRRLLAELPTSHRPEHWRIEVLIGTQFATGWGALKPQVGLTIQRFLDEPQLRPYAYDVAPGFKLRFRLVRDFAAAGFSLSGVCDFRASGPVVDDLRDSLLRCITEKTRKIATVQSAYSTWWLVLVDHLHGRVPETFSVEEFWRDAPNACPFDSVVILNGWGSDWAFRLRG